MRTRTLILSLIAAFALSALAAGAAQAFHRPTWRKGGAAIATNTPLNVNNNSDTSRLWVGALGTVIVCKKDVSTGTIENHENAAHEIEGLDKGTVTYEECSLWSTKENGAKQLMQNERLAACAVQDAVHKEAGKIVTKSINSFLAYVPGREPGNRSGPSGPTEATEDPVQVVEVFEPATAPFVTIEVTGGLCAAKGAFEVTGSVIGTVPRVETEVIAGVTEQPASGNEEAVMGDVLFETRNEPGAKTVVQHSGKKYELNKVVTEAFLKFGTSEAALESTEQVELESLEPFGVHA